jgi:hypothetical protein
MWGSSQNPASDEFERVSQIDDDVLWVVPNVLPFTRTRQGLKPANWLRIWKVMS